MSLFRLSCVVIYATLRIGIGVANPITGHSSNLIETQQSTNSTVTRISNNQYNATTSRQNFDNSVKHRDDRGASSSRHRCHNPSKKVLKLRLKKFNNLYDEEGAIGVVPFEAPPLHPPREYESVQETCPPEEERIHACPVTYVKNEDPNRFPRVIDEAKCLCDECLNPGPGKVSDRECQPVKYNMKVLRRHGCVNGVFRYDLDIEPIAVSCSCVKIGLRP